MVGEPQSDINKIAFLDELHAIRDGCSGPLLLCGDFNMIYKAEYKSNSILNRRMMGLFCRFIDNTELQELHLNGRRFTRSNERDNPMLRRLDRVFASEDGCPYTRITSSPLLHPSVRIMPRVASQLQHPYIVSSGFTLKIFGRSLMGSCKWSRRCGLAMEGCR